jgi:hypothetical protein
MELEWTKEDGVSAHVYLSNRAEGEEILSRFLEATGGRYEAFGAEVYHDMVKFGLHHEDANADHTLKVWLRTTKKGLRAYTFRLDHYDHFQRCESWAEDVRGTLKTCVKKVAEWDRPIGDRLEKYWQEYQRSMAMLKAKGYERIDGNRFLAADVMALEVAVNGLIRIHNPDYRSVEDIIAAIRPR